MKNLNSVATCVALFLSAQAWAGSNSMRMDCRFYSDKHFCYSSAVYNIDRRSELNDIRFGVGCDYETIYDDGGTSDPQEQVSDSLRPRTAAFPRVELEMAFGLRHAGSYTAKLETDHGKFTDGICYVKEADEEGDAAHFLDADWLAFGLN